MLLNRQSVEILAPAGSWEVLETVIEAGADAVYLGGKRFNMRMHRADTNFDDEQLEKAIQYAHERGVKLYVTVNNLISSREIDAMRDYLMLLERIQPDALIVQDLAIMELAKEIGFTVPLHTSIMRNTHNSESIRKYQEYGITRIVASRDLTLDQIRLMREQTGIEIEFFIHGDMCVSQSGQCVHSGVVFGQSSNRGRCLKPCRWPYQLIDEETGEVIPDSEQTGPYKLALKDMCMYRHLPELIQAGVHSFKIEGRMRTADFVKRIVSIYRRAVDRYLADPTSYTIDENDWKELYENRSRDFSTCYALSNTLGSKLIGYDGSREPRFFSQAVKEATLDVKAKLGKDKSPAFKARPQLSVRVASLSAVEVACKNGADIIYIGGDAFRPNKPWSLADIREAMRIAEPYNVKVVVMTQRITPNPILGELEQHFTALKDIAPHGIMVSNTGAMKMAKEITGLPLYADFSFNTFNHYSTKWQSDNGIVQSTMSVEASHEQIVDLLQTSRSPIELIVHGPIEAMVSEHSIPSAVLGLDNEDQTPIYQHQYALLDTAGQKHSIRFDQHGKSHILLANDYCLFPYLPKLTGAATYRIEGHIYDDEHLAFLLQTYRAELDSLYTAPQEEANADRLASIKENAPRPLGIGALRFRVSR